MSPKTLAKTIVHHYDDKPEAFKTKSAVDLPKMAQVKDSFKGLVDALKSSEVPPELVAAAIQGSQNFGITTGKVYPFYDQIRDLKGLAANLADAEIMPDKKVRAAAKALVASVGEAVIDNLAHKYERYEITGEGRSLDGKETFTEYRQYSGQYDSHGLSVFAPLSEKLAKGPKMAEYKALDFTQDTGWGDYMVSLNEKLVAAQEKQGNVVARPANPDQV